MKSGITLGVVAFAALVIARESAVAAEKGGEWRFDAGGDFRLRQEIFENIPFRRADGLPETIDELDYFRFRTRIWGEAEYENLRLHARLANEFR